MRKSRSLPTVTRAPLHPTSRPSGTPRAPGLAGSGVGTLGGTFGDYQAPSGRWEHANTKLANRQAYEERSVWANDSFDIHRPLQQRLPRPKPEKVWRMTDIGNKLTFSSTEGFNRDAANSSWDMYRPINKCPPPWANSAYPRAAFASAACMSQSMRQ
mmetsp:Transcript_32295/g.68762  ORF Transcript_32295/g.68762 Transcript_32295/m.68762 type:complete len:157 (+) Transcript_32295:92-562(+)